MRRLLLSTCIAGLALVASPPAFANDADACDMLCRLRNYLATDHMAPESADVPGQRVGGSKHARSAAAAHKPKPALAAAPAASTPDVAGAKTAPATKIADARPKHPKTVLVADTKPAQAPRPQRPRVIAEAATPATKTAVARPSPPAARRQAAAMPAGSKITPKRVAARLATSTAPQSSSLPPVQTARAAERTPGQTATATESTTTPTATIPGSAPLVAAGFR